MKKFLIASTALAAMTGVAVADVTLSGDAQMTLQYDNRLEDAAGNTKSGVNVRSRVRVTTTMSGETDNGLSFGARLRTGDGDYTESRDNWSSDTTLWVEGAYGRLTIGDVDNALENAVGDLVGIGNSGLSFYNEMYYAFDGGDTLFQEHNNKGVLYTYKYGDATFYASFEDKYRGLSGVEYAGDDHWSLGATYDVNQYSFGIGYAQGGEWGDGDVDSWGIHAAADFNGVNVKGIYLESKADDSKLKQYGIGADYDMANGVGLQGFIRINDWSGTGAPYDGKTKFYGVGASYDLGGGASLNGGLVHIDDESGSESGGVWEDRTMVDVGLKFNF